MALVSHYLDISFFTFSPNRTLMPQLAISTSLAGWSPCRGRCTESMAVEHETGIVHAATVKPWEWNILGFFHQRW